MTEKVFTFGPDGSLLGILAEPDPSQKIAGAPALLMWNVGINHRVGPSRINVDLARELAAAGFTSLRFDISGLGDSQISRDARPEHERAAADVRQAMSALRSRRGIDSFVLIGFCSSVDSAHAVGVADPAVAGVVYLEGYTFRTRGFRARYWMRYLDLNLWERFLRVRYPGLLGEVEGLDAFSGKREAVYVRDYPSEEKFRGDVDAMVTRGLRLLFLYFGRNTRYVHRDQLLEVLGKRDFGGKLDLEFYKEADHTLFYEGDRARVVRRVVRWAVDSFKTRSPVKSASQNEPAA